MHVTTPQEMLPADFLYPDLGSSGGPAKVAGSAVRKGRQVGADSPVRKESHSGCRKREVVQRVEGFRIHPARGWRGRVRSLLGDLRRGLQDAGGGRASG